MFVLYWHVCPLVLLAYESLHECTVCIWCCEHMRFCVDFFFKISAKYEFSIIHSSQNMTTEQRMRVSAIVTTFYVSSKVYLNLLFGHLPTTSVSDSEQ